MTLVKMQNTKLTYRNLLNFYILTTNYMREIKDAIPSTFTSKRIKQKSVLVTQSFLTLCDPIVWPWDSPEKNTRVCCHSLFQGIFPTQGSNLGVLHCRQILYNLSYHGSHIKKNKIPRNKSKEGKDLYPENYDSDERNCRQHKQM